MIDPRGSIPETCKAGVVVNEGPDFHVEIQTVPVPRPGASKISQWPCEVHSVTDDQHRARRTSAPTQRDWLVHVGHSLHV